MLAPALSRGTGPWGGGVTPGATHGSFQGAFSRSPSDEPPRSEMRQARELLSCCCGIGPCGVPRPSLADYVRGPGPPGRRPPLMMTILLSGDQTLHHARVDGSGALGHHAQINAGNGPARQGTQHLHVAVAAAHQ